MNMRDGREERDWREKRDEQEARGSGIAGNGVTGYGGMKMWNGPEVNVELGMWNGLKKLGMWN